MPEDTLRDSLGKAFDKVETPAATDTPAVETPAKEETPAVETPAKVETPAVETPAKVETPAVETPAVETPAKTEAKVEKKAPVAETKAFKPPVSWKPAIREKHWNTLPTEVQAEVFRREREIETALQSTAEARKGAEQLNQVYSQYKDFFEFEKVHPMQSITNVLNIARGLRFSPGPQKAQLMAQVIQGFGVDVKLLDQALSMLVGGGDPNAKASQDNAAAVEAIVSKHLAPVKEFMSGINTTRQTAAQKAEEAMRAEIAEFAADPKNVYFDLVKDAMADIMEVGATRGQQISLPEAYKRAILANNDLAAEYSQQLLKENAGKVSAPAAQSASLAAMSVTGAPGAPGAHVAGANLRADIEAAAAKVQGRA